MKKKFLALTLALGLSLGLVACNTWPTIIATAQAISTVTSVFYPPVASLSALAVNLLQQAESCAQAYQSHKSASTEAAYVAAIQDIETRLPADLQALNVPPADKVKVEAAVNIVLDYVEALGVQAPVTSHTIAQARVARAAKPLPKPLSNKQIKARWDAEVCQGDKVCTAKIKGPGFLSSLGNAIGEAKFGGH